MTGLSRYFITVTLYFVQELLRVILSYSVCYNASEANKLQSLLKPVLPFLITRCADAQRLVCYGAKSSKLVWGWMPPLNVL